MATIKLDKIKYSVSNDKCIGCTCLYLGQYQSRGATLSGTGNYSYECMRRAYHGCPDESARGYSLQLVQERKQQGMKNL